MVGSVRLGRRVTVFAYDELSTDTSRTIGEDQVPTHHDNGRITGSNFGFLLGCLTRSSRSGHYSCLYLAQQQTHILASVYENPGNNFNWSSALRLILVLFPRSVISFVNPHEDICMFGLLFTRRFRHGVPRVLVYLVRGSLGPSPAENLRVFSAV